jgi:hypothetical protein
MLDSDSLGAIAFDDRYSTMSRSIRIDFIGKTTIAEQAVRAQPSRLRSLGRRDQRAALAGD